MILPNFKDFVAVLPKTGRILAIDWGARRIGLAVSDENQDFAFPHTTHDIASPKKKSGTLIDKIPLLNENIAGVVIGFPTYLDGTESDTTAKVRAFTESNAMGLNDKIPVTFLDEALSSAEAQEIFNAATKKDQGKGLDAYAAAIILEDALAKIKRIRHVGQ